jgi:hypothetical protein
VRDLKKNLSAAAHHMTNLETPMRVPQLSFLPCFLPSH